MTELGSFLRETREEKGWSLDDLQQMTKIQKRYLRGIEEGDYGVMPGQFYVRAFIKQYAETLGLSSEAIFEQYAADLPQTVTEEIPELTRAQSKKLPESSGKFFDIFPKILIAVFMIGALTLVWYFWPYKEEGAPLPVDDQESGQIKVEDTGKLTDNPQEEDAEDEEEAPAPEVVEKEEPKQVLVPVSQSGKTATYKLTNSDKFHLKVTSPGESWIEIKNRQGKVFDSGMVSANQPAGMSVDLTNESEAVIIVGRATEADIFINDEKLSYEIPPTEQVRQDIVIQFEKSE